MFEKGLLSSDSGPLDNNSRTGRSPAHMNAHSGGIFNRSLASFCHQHPQIVTNFKSPTSRYHQHHRYLTNLYKKLIFLSMLKLIFCIKWYFLPLASGWCRDPRSEKLFRADRGSLGWYLFSVHIDNKYSICKTSCHQQTRLSNNGFDIGLSDFDHVIEM